MTQRSKHTKRHPTKNRATKGETATKLDAFDAASALTPARFAAGASGGETVPAAFTEQDREAVARIIGRRGGRLEPLPRGGWGVTFSPAAPSPEPTFTLAEFRSLLGDNCFPGTPGEPAAAVAREAIDDAVRSLRVLYAALWHEQHENVERHTYADFVFNVYTRLEAAGELVWKMSRAGSEVRS